MTTKKQKTAFHEDVLNEMKHQLKSLHRNMQRLNKIEITVEEMYQALVRPEDQPILRQAYALTHGPGSTSMVTTSTRDFKVNGGTMTVYFKMRGLNSLVPAYAYDGFVNDPENEITAKVTAWLEKRVELGQKFGLIDAALNWMDNTFSKPEPALFFMVSLVHLLKDRSNKHVMALLSAHSANPVPKALPALEPKFRDLFQEMSELIASAVLLPVIPDDTRAELVTFDTDTIPGVQLPWSEMGTRAMNYW